MKKKTCQVLIFLCCIVFLSIPSYAQQNDSLKQSVADLKKDVESLKKLKVTGWVQAQFQWAQSKGAENLDGGKFAPYSDKRFMIRRGRVKFTYTQKLSQFVLQLNGTERGLNLVEIYAKVTAPWNNALSLTAGVMNRPFGFEIDQSSAVRESPERSRYSQILMPNERDLGAKITYEPGKDHKLHGLRLDAGFYNGQGIAVPGTSSTTGPFVNDGVNEFDFIKYFIGRLFYYKDSKDGIYRYGLGISHYNGGVINQSNVVYDHYETGPNGVIFAPADTTQGQVYKNTSASRKYFGTEFFINKKSNIGTTTFRGEYIFGTQPGTVDNVVSPASLPLKTATYLRKFNGAYVYLIQRIAQTKHEILVKGEFFDPNSNVTNSDLNGLNGMTRAEIKFTALGLGYNYYHDDNVKFMFYYNMVTNEETQISGYTKNLKDNIITVRMQYKF